MKQPQKQGTDNTISRY